MPKKFKGENSKAVDARARKAAAQHAAEEKRQKDAEDAYWADDDKHVARKQQRKVPLSPLSLLEDGPGHLIVNP